MIKITLTPRGLASRRLLLKCLRLLWALSVFIVRLLFAFLRFALMETTRKQAMPNSRTNENPTKKQSKKFVLQEPPKQIVQDMVFEPTAFVVKIAPTEPFFNEKIKALKSRGYRWHSELNAWAVPKVRLGNNNPNFDRIIAELKLAGYIWNGSCWTLYFPVSRNPERMKYAR